MNILLVFIFGILGGISRMELGDIIPKLGGFPLGTLIINLSGCFVFGFLIKHLFVVKKVPERMVLLAGTGFIGTFTTFSSLILDAVQLMNKGLYGLLALYLILEITGSLLFLIFGIEFGRKVIKS